MKKIRARVDWLLESQWTVRLIVIFGVGSCLNFAGLGAALFLIRGQARNGEMARARQQAIFPVSIKVYEWAHGAGKITDADLACFKTGRGCPRSRPTP
jgi:hypothetical protein